MHYIPLTSLFCRTYKHDGKTTYCYYIAEKYSVEQPLEADILVKDTGSACPVQVTVDIADQVEKNVLIDITYTATIDTSSQDSDFEFPIPIVQVPVPDYLLSNSSNTSSSSTTAYDVAVANVVVCDWDKCDPFSTEDGNGNYFSTANNPNDFDDNVAVFGSKEIIITKDARYSGYVHLVVNIAGNSRADFVTFFPVQVGDVVGTAPSGIVADSETTYCWTLKDMTPFEDNIEQTDIAVRTDSNCPASMKSALSKTSVQTGEAVVVQWTLQVDTTTTDPSNLIAEISEVDAIKNPSTGIWSVVPVSVLSACQKNAEDASCSTYSGGDSTTFDIQEYNDYNLTDDSVTYSTNHTFTTAGTYLLISRVAMMTTDGDRIDMAVYSSLEVTIPDTSGGGTFLYVGLAIGGVILLVGLLFCVIKKRRSKTNTKNIPFREPQMPLQSIDRMSEYTAASSNFLTHKTPAGGPEYRIPQTSISSDHSRPMTNHSFSLDPYASNSFVNQHGDSEDDNDHSHGFDRTMNMSDAAKFSFQSGYDDSDSEWDFEGSSVGTDSKLSDYGDIQRGTFQMQPGLPILEEDDDNSFLQRVENEPRSTTSSGWTINTH